jgi:diguanylate cyclase (GGDEF)-like protein
MTTDSGTLCSLLELTRELLDGPPLDGALKTVTDAAMEMLPCEHASIRILDDSRTTLLCGARSGEGIVERPMSFRAGEGIIGWVARHGLPARVHDTLMDPRFKEGGGQGFSVRSLLAVPLLAQGKVMGVLGAVSSEVRVFSAEHEILATLLANCAVPAIDKARLERLAMTDQETMAYGPSAFMPRLLEEVSRARRHQLPLSLLYVHVDHLEPEGKMVRFFADTLRFCLRSTDILVRVGDYEFAVILLHTGAGPAVRTVADRVRGALEEAELDDEHPLSPPCIGVATWDATEPAEQLEERALGALTKAHPDQSVVLV